MAADDEMATDVKGSIELQHFGVSSNFTSNDFVAIPDFSYP
jgi:hypothetical protein